MQETKLSDETMENLLTLLLYRLGGEQTFTAKEVKDIAKSVGGATLAVDKDGRMILRARTREAMKKLTIKKKKKAPVANTGC